LIKQRTGHSMPWNDNEKPGNDGPTQGPWGSGPQPPRNNPWGNPSGGGGGQGGGDGQGPNNQRDLEEMMRRMQDRFRGSRRGGGGQGGDGRGLQLGPRGVALMAGLVGLGWLATGVYLVSEGQRAVVTTFGQFSRVSAPGLHVRLPFPFEQHRTVSVTAQQRINVGTNESAERNENETLMITSEKNIVDVDFAITWQISDPQQFLFNLTGDSIGEKSETIRAAGQSVMREVIGQRRLQDIITTERAGVEDNVREQMQRILDYYQSGVRISAIQLQKAEAPTAVIESFNEVIKAQQDAEGARNVAQGEKQKQIAEATGYRDQKVREARGEAERFNLVYEQYRLSPQTTRQRLYLETMERIYARSQKVMLDTRGSGVAPIVPLDQLRRPVGPAAAAVTAPAQAPTDQQGGR
jgi:modulator of FtsH protease HflK